MEFSLNSQNRAEAALVLLWLLDYKSEREESRFAVVDPRGTTRECSNCGVEAEQPLWVRDHSYPSCVFKADRDLNAAYNTLARGLDQVGMSHSDAYRNRALCGNRSGSCKARRRNRKSRPQRGRKAKQAG